MMPLKREGGRPLLPQSLYTEETLSRLFVVSQDALQRPALL